MVLELGGGAQLLRLAGAVVVALFIAGIVAALLVPRTGKRKAVWLAVLVVPVAAAVVSDGIESWQSSRRRQQAEEAFQEHCKTAGVRIYKKVQDVDGVLLMKRRPEDQSTSSQHAPDPYGKDLGGDAYAHTMLWGRDSLGYVLSTVETALGYHFVVMPNADGSGYTRFELTTKNARMDEWKVAATPVTALPRYGVSWEDISSAADRERWIAGSRLFVVDTQTGEVLAERIGWIFDRALGSDAGQRQPWLFAAAHACPPLPKLPNDFPYTLGQTRDFVERVLIPSKKETKT
jgi:hypothetical protein